MRISFVIPIYNERDSLVELVRAIGEYAGSHDVQIILVDDGSTDGSYEVMCSLREKYDAVETIRFRRNLGKSAALAAGFAQASGEVVFTMDADLQDDPKEIPRFIEKLEEGFDVVVGWKKVRRDPWHKVFPSKVYNFVVSRMFSLPLHDANCGFKLLRKEVVEKIALYGERHRLLPMLAAGLGYKIAEIPIEHHPRRYGKSKYGMERFARGALDVATILFLSRYAHVPGHFFGAAGVAQMLIGIAGVLMGVSFWFLGSPPFWIVTSIVAGVVLFVAGGAAFSLGLIWEMLLHFFVPVDPTIYIDKPRDESS